MNKSVVIFLFTLILLVSALTGCISSVSPTSSPIPIVTSTNEPTHTPIPTIEPPPIANELLTGVQITFYDPLDDAAYWDLGGASIDNGELVMPGRNFWASSISLKRKLGDGEGVILKFKLQNVNGHSEFTLVTGDWQTDGFRQFGIFNVRIPTADIWQGKNSLGGNELNGNLYLKPDTWYNLLIAIGKNGQFLATMWDDNNHRLTYKETPGEKWMGKKWYFMPKADEGETMYIDNVYGLTFSDIK